MRGDIHLDQLAHYNIKIKLLKAFSRHNINMRSSKRLLTYEINIFKGQSWGGWGHNNNNAVI